MKAVEGVCEHLALKCEIQSLFLHRRLWEGRHLPSPLEFVHNARIEVV